MNDMPTKCIAPSCTPELRRSDRSHDFASRVNSRFGIAQPAAVSGPERLLGVFGLLVIVNVGYLSVIALIA